MKFEFGALVCVAAALMPAAQAAVDITFTSGKFNRRDDSTVVKQKNPEFGMNLANQYIIRKGAGLPPAKDVKETYPECKWRHYAGSFGWLDDYNVQCYLSPSYKFHAHSIAKAFKAEPSTKAGACFDTANTDQFPEGVPKYSIGVPYLYMNNLYDRRCKVRAMVKIPKTDEHEEKWVQAWVIDHNLGNWDKDGKENDAYPKDGVLIDTNMYEQFFDKNKKVPDYSKTVPVEWFFLDINTVG
ncbi:uncharacterized protein UMAG_01820 [Mycosarcoma maydis]|uniref:Uncharacterized protein n=1 Tax=Mycosarcoma maydis TaxID=5270 RepID=A0A0D1E4Q7_MYCMD|nr:uncharacterized protein UMAG_01820 [Ustilago maydis 521]KIS70656.1 hypothetical protein UMAG_01820 [Ustilago maydis 521]|eukprot:XP_011387768.1 hypothetical protein UMAG_01820 [Ustilago maydis 521]